MPLAASDPQTTLRGLAFFFFLSLHKCKVNTLGLGTTMEVQEAWLRSVCGDGEFGSGQSDLEVIPVLRSQCYINLMFPCHGYGHLLLV